MKPGCTFVDRCTHLLNCHGLPLAAGLVDVNTLCVGTKSKVRSRNSQWALLEVPHGQVELEVRYGRLGR
jgi:hypothetical protein